MNHPSSPTNARRLEFAPGETLELPAAHCWTLVRGEVLVYRAERPVEAWRSPGPLDVAGTWTGTPRARFVAVNAVTVEGVPFEHMSATELAAALAAENAKLWQRIETDVIRDDDTFLPEAVPVPGPWHFRDARAAVFVVQGNAARIASTLPRGVRMLPGTGGRYVLALARFEQVHSLDPRDESECRYHEITPFLPVWSGWRGPAGYVPVLYPDAHMATLLGREIHGFPKRTSRIGWHDDGVELIVGHALTLRARWVDRTPVEPIEFTRALLSALWGRSLPAKISSLLERVGRRVTPPLYALVRKRIGDAKSAGNIPQIDELCRVRITLDPVVHVARLDGATIEFLQTQDILHGEIVAGWFVESGFRFGSGERERKLR